MNNELLSEDPRWVGSYQLVSRLGAGATGVVFEAMSSDGNRVALKVLHESLISSPGIRERLRREGVALQRVVGARAVRVLEVDADGPRPFLAMELVEGQTLDNYVNSFGPVRGALLWGLAEGLVEALLDIHSAGIIHRDLKPSNVLLGPDGVRVVDFGISVLADAASLTGTGSFVGTAAWLSPEQVQGEDVDGASDIFGLGMLLAYASAGHHPFGYGRSDAVMYRIIHSEPRLDDVPSALTPIVIGCLMKDPSDRPSLSDIRRLLAEADRSSSSDSEALDSRHTRVVSKDEQIQALIGSDDSKALINDDRDVRYDLSAWSLERRARLTDAFKLQSVGYRIEGDELIVDESDEDRVDEIIEYVLSQLNRVLNPLAAAVVGPLPAVKNPASYDNSNRKRFLGLVAAVFLIGGVVTAINQSSSNDDGVSTQTSLSRGTTTTLAANDEKVRKLRSALTNLDGRVIEALEDIEAGEEYSTIKQDAVSALLMTDVIQTDCRGRWIVNETLARAGLETVLYDNYFSNYFGDQSFPGRYIATRAAITVLRNSNPNVGAFAKEAISVLGGYSRTCEDSDFYFSDEEDLETCVEYFPTGSWSMITADVICVESVLRSVPWETDTEATKNFELSVDDDRWTLPGDTLLVGGRGANRQGAGETSLFTLVWVDPSGEFAVVVRSHATNYDSIVAAEDLNERASAAFASVITSFFEVVEPIIAAGND